MVSERVRVREIEVHTNEVEALHDRRRAVGLCLSSTRPVTRCLARTHARTHARTVYRQRTVVVKE